VRRVHTAAVKGDFTPKEALDRMLDGTGLRSVVQDEKTGALAVGETRPNAARAAQDDQRPPRQAQARLKTARWCSTPIRSGHARFRIVNEGVIPRRENEAINYIVFDRLRSSASGARTSTRSSVSPAAGRRVQADTQSLTAQRDLPLSARCHLRDAGVDMPRLRQSRARPS